MEEVVVVSFASSVLELFAGGAFGVIVEASERFIARTGVGIQLADICCNIIFIIKRYRVYNG